MPKGPFAAVLFDLDGTLVDTRLDFAALRLELGFPEGIGVLEHLATLEDPEQAAWASTVIDRHEMEGAAVARTNAVLGLPVDLILTREDCAPKPHPEGLLLIADQLGLRPAATVYVGDFVFDLQAARNAGMASGLLRNGKNRHFEDQADLVLDHLGEVLDWL